MSFDIGHLPVDYVNYYAELAKRDPLASAGNVLADKGIKTLLQPLKISLNL